MIIRLWPVLAVGSILLAAASGGWWVAATWAERDRLATEVAEQTVTLQAYDEALAETEEQRKAVAEALAHAHDQTARLTVEHATILGKLKNATAPDCPVPATVRDAVDRLWPLYPATE